MATFHGKKGLVYWDLHGTEITEVTDWTLDATADVAEKTAMQDTWKTYLAGFLDWTATVTCRAQDSGPEVPYSAGGVNALGEDINYAAPDNKAKLDLYMVYDIANTKYRGLYGDAVCVGISHTVDANEIGMVTYTFKGSGALAVFSADDVDHTYV